MPTAFIGRRLEVRETPDRVVIYQGPREITTHPREAEPRSRYVFRPEHRPPRGQGWRHEREPFPEAQALRRLLPEIEAYLDALKRRGKLQTTLALRQLLRMAREYPREPLLAAIQTAAHYGLYDLARLERMVLPMSRPMDELQQLLKNLHLTRMAEGLPDELQRAEKDGLAYTDLLLRLVRAQWHHRQETALEWRIRQARLPERWALETFPFKEQPGVNKRQIMSLAELDFIPTATNIVFIGPTGVGKSGLATGLLLKALQNGYRALFIKAQDLFDEMYASLADRSSRKLVDRLARVPLLCLDEMGYLNLRPEQCNIFFKLMEERYRRRASIITTNLDYDDWMNFLGNKHMVTALLSRLRHQCTTIRIDGPSLREPQG